MLNANSTITAEAGHRGQADEVRVAVAEGLHGATRPAHQLAERGPRRSAGAAAAPLPGRRLARRDAVDRHADTGRRRCDGAARDVLVQPLAEPAGVEEPLGCVVEVQDRVVERRQLRLHQLVTILARLSRMRSIWARLLSARPEVVREPP